MTIYVNHGPAGIRTIPRYKKSRAVTPGIVGALSILRREPRYRHRGSHDTASVTMRSARRWGQVQKKVEEIAGYGLNGVDTVLSA